MADYRSAVDQIQHVLDPGISVIPGVAVGGGGTYGTGAIATNATAGFLHIAGGAGAPTGVPTLIAGYVPVYIDTTNNFLYLYVNGSWKKTTVFA